MDDRRKRHRLKRELCERGTIRDEDGRKVKDTDGDDWAETVVNGAEIGIETTEAFTEPLEGSKEGERVGVRR